ncbi:MAG: asparagine synthase (glutamine-hydrolyzing) [Bacteroidota bacterium]|jgi:asparagine synthase (glutamine-hydrolysing)
MCGIAGLISSSEPVSKSLFTHMVNTLQHRGPDDSGVFLSEDDFIALGHRRLSFLDLSSAGKQPLKSSNQNSWITFNGEIYNYLELKEELNTQYIFQTETDTEVVLAAYQTWGISFIHKLKGMFAFAIYDEHKKKLLLARDRFGIKPLYYAHAGKQFVFASELKAIVASGIVDKQVDFSSFTDYFVYRYIPSPKTIWKDVYKLPPATFMEIDTQTLAQETVEYWNLNSSNSSQPDDDLIREIDYLLKQSVKEHTRADVPIGSFLSGGYDSSALVNYMKTIHQDPETFSIGFSKWEKSEDQFAAIVAKHIGVNNTAVVADEDSLLLIDKMAEVYDEPIADISIVPTFMVSKLARTKVKAVLSGEGADEIFGGYTWQHEFMKKTNANWLTQLLGKKSDTVGFYAQAMAMGWFDSEELKRMLHPRLHQFIHDDVHWFYRKHYKSNLSPLKSIQYLDMKCFMGELVLTKIDRASMANSLEVRVPFLDHTLVEKVFSLNESSYFRPNQTKYLLFENIKNSLPHSILERKKQGFVGPDSYYMNLDFYRRELANSTLVKAQLVNQGYIDDLLKESYNWKLWKILVMEKWFKRWVDLA